MPEPKNWSGPTNKDATIIRTLDGHIASDFGEITDRDHSNRRRIDDAPYFDLDEER